MLFGAANLRFLAQLESTEATTDTTEGLFYFVTCTIKHRHWREPWGLLSWVMCLLDVKYVLCHMKSLREMDESDLCTDLPNPCSCLCILSIYLWYVAIGSSHCISLLPIREISICVMFSGQWHTEHGPIFLLLLFPYLFFSQSLPLLRPGHTRPIFGVDRCLAVNERPVTLLRLVCPAPPCLFGRADTFRRRFTVG